jgi:hypothetical protein
VLTDMAELPDMRDNFMFSSSAFLRLKVGEVMESQNGLHPSEYGFLHSSEALAAKREVEKGLTEKIGSVQEFKRWIDSLD